MLDRRLFLGTAAITPFVLTIRGFAGEISLGDIHALADSFAAPPPTARPWVYWFWVNGNVTREGITADLEAMARVGLGGVLIMDVDPGTPAGLAPFGSDAWLEMFNFAVREANRLGLEINLNNDAGWAGSAGPWITPELSMQKIVWSERSIEGGVPFDGALDQPETNAGYYRDVAVLAFPTPDDGGYRIPEIAFKAGFATNVGTYLPEQGIPPMPTDQSPLPVALTINPQHIVDISAQFGDGRLRWTPPAGRWTVMRFGHTSTGADNHPVAQAGRGLECDKMSKTALDSHFGNFIGKMASAEKGLVGKTLVSTHIDSWEAGAQNWTGLFREEFFRLRGYDLLPWLPVMSGRVVGGAELAERFLWDVRQTISELVVENYAGEMRRLAGASGMRLSVEAYDGDPTNQMAYAGQADEPQAEFWLGRDFFPGVFRSWFWVANMTSAAHVYGKRVVGAEAFTAMPGEDWQAHPATLKPLGDWAFCKGINHFVFHRYAMQPWRDRKPGMTMGAWGIHYERTQTWWENAGPWHAYLTRCQHVLRQGVFVADLLYLTPEGAPMRFAPPDVDIRSGTPPDTPGYNYDGCPPDALYDRVTIRKGMIVLPDGMQYRMLVLPDSSGDMRGAGTMTPRLIRRIGELVEQGMTLIGPPPKRSPSLANYPACDAEVTEVVARLWGAVDGVTSFENRVGKGRVIWGRTPPQQLAADGVPPDFSVGADTPFRYIHRRLGDGTDIYFVANKEPARRKALCRFRVVGRRPEFWNPETGAVVFPAVYNEVDGCTELSLHLDDHQSLFVVFPTASRAEPDRLTAVYGADQDLSLERKDGRLLASATVAGRYSLEMVGGRRRTITVAELPAAVAVTGPWDVRFAPGWGAPEHIVLPKLISWTEHEDDGVRHFSGTAVYRSDFHLPPAMLARGLRVRLDLGEVAVMSRVRLNGRNLGILWKSPFVVDATGALRAGTNRLELMITNLWPNRMIRDEALPEDAMWKPNPYADQLPGFGECLAEWPQWLLDGKQSPAGRYTFATWKLWSKNAPLLRSGLIGPVILSNVRTIAV